MIMLLDVTTAHRWSTVLLALGVAALALALPVALFTNVMGFNFDPTEEPLDYWPAAVLRYQTVLYVALVLIAIGVSCFISKVVITRGDPSFVLGLACAVLLGIGLTLLALHGALPNIEQAQLWSTRPPI